jgi:hypothetical protein
MTLLGLDWKGGPFKHPFDIVDVPQKSGVFKFHGQRRTGEWEVFYVGEATNLYNTLVMYMGTVIEGDAAAAGLNRAAQRRLAAGDCYYSCAVVTNERDRKGSLRSLYQYFKPSGNDPDALPDVSDVGCNPF